jgi:enoyl-CoA hydratase/carnithine racemase
MIDLRHDGPVATGLLDNAAKLNAMTRPFWSELREMLTELEDDPEVRVLIFRGAGRCFSVGGDIAGFGELGDAGDRRAYVAEALAALRAVERFPKPTIAAVHGHALGGGCELTMVADIVVADESASFGLPETQVGLVPGLVVARGEANLNAHWLKYLVLTGESLGAEEARLAGLVNIVTPVGGHVAMAEDLARKIAGRAPLAMAVAKSVMARGSDADFGLALEAVSFLQGTADLAEGVAAFEQGRPPRFAGR